MTKANKAVSLGISDLIVIALILIVGFGVYLAATFSTTRVTEEVDSHNGHVHVPES